MAQTFKRLVHPGDAPHLAVALKRYVSNIEQNYSTLDSPVFTGDPQAPTPPTADNDTSIATTAFVKNQNYAPLASPIFTGDPRAPTPVTADNDTSIATTAFVKTQGYLIGNQTITLSGDVSGSGTTAIPVALATVNANVGTFQGLTLDGKGRVTAATNQNYVTGGPYLPLAGGTLTGALTVDTAANPGLLVNSGNVGIGTTAPDSKLEILNSAAAGGSAAIHVGTGPNGADATSYMLYFTDFGNTVGIGSISRTGTNSVAYNTSSDMRLKDGITDSQRGLDTLMAIKVSDYTMGDTASQGLLAQDVAKVYPEAVHEGGDDPNLEPWMIDYGRLTPLLIRTIQQQQTHIDDVERRLAVLEARA